MHWRLEHAWRRLRSTWRRVEDDTDMDDEMHFHLDMATARNVSRGMAPDAARRAALVAFGGVDRAREDAWDVQRARWLEDAWHDARHSVRMLRRTPAFTLAALATLALGIGANSAIFSVLDAVLLRPLPYAEPSEIVVFSPGRYDSYREWTEGARTIESAGAYTYSIANVSGGSTPARVWTLAVTASLLPTLGVEPQYGRNFSAADDLPGAPPRVLLRHGFWRTHFGGDRTLVGRTIDVNGRAHEVIGILPAELEFPPPIRQSGGSLPSRAELWTGAGWLSDLHERGGFHAVARLAPGATADRASAELTAAANATATASREPLVISARPVHDAVVAPLRPAILVFMGGVGLVLLIACANLGSLLLARLAGRQRELAVRISLGAARGRIVRQILTEGAMLALGGALAGLALAWVMLRALIGLAPADLARVHDATLNPRVLAVTLAIALLTAVLIGVLPALRAVRRDPRDAIGSTRGATTDRATGRSHALLLACEIAFAVVLLIGGGLLLRSFAALANVDPGFRSAGLVTADVLVPADRYPSRAHLLDFFARVEDRLEALPGVQSVSAIDRLPYGPSISQLTVLIRGREIPAAEAPRAYNASARPGYFRTMGIPIVEGREFTSADHPDAPRVVVIGQALARRWWPDRSPLRDHVQVFGVDYEIIGVAGDIRHLGPSLPADPMLYLPQAQDVATRRMMTIVVRADGQPDALLARVRSELRGLDALLPVENLRTFGALQSERTAGERFNALLIASFATIAVLLAAVGIYGVLSFIVAQRTREIGVRMALGATRVAVLGMFLRQAMRAVAIGALLGLAIALPLTGLARGMLFGIEPTDPATYLAVVLVVGAIALVAAWVPAERAARVSPRTAMISE